MRHGFLDDVAATNSPLANFAQRVVTEVFVDAAWPHRFWRCHRNERRSFFVKGRQFHVCARCTGLITGIALMPAAALLPSRALIACGVSSILVITFDGTLQAFYFYDSTNLRRFTTGVLAAAFVPALALSLMCGWVLSG
ncbi:MAG: DUF2085 domain-containing protein [Gemmatimonadaceae bacterium]|nr:DUF2085 domain-containing protein [Gemmatimonadaceae bacterium]